MQQPPPEWSAIVITNEQEHFINTMGDTLATWRLPRSTGRVYGYLLLRGDASSTEELCSRLHLSAGAVSTATRELVSWGLARTLPKAGSRRLLIEAAGGFEQLLAASHERTRTFIRTLRAAEALTENAAAATRLRDVTALFTAYVDAAEHTLEDYRSR